MAIDIKKLNEVLQFGYKKTTKDIVGYKKLETKPGSYKSVIAKVIIPKGSLIRCRFTGFTSTDELKRKTLSGHHSLCKCLECEPLGAHDVKLRANKMRIVEMKACKVSRLGTPSSRNGRHVRRAVSLYQRAINRSNKHNVLIAAPLTYVINTTKTCHNFNRSNKECAAGLHFFLTRREAENW